MGEKEIQPAGDVVKAVAPGGVIPPKTPPQRPGGQAPTHVLGGPGEFDDYKRDRPKDSGKKIL